MKTLLFDLVDEQIGILTLHRPEVRNAINSQMMQELLQFWQNRVVDSGAIRCLILTGSSELAFCAGADLKERKNMDLKTWKKQHFILQQAMISMVQCPIPILAAVNGVAFGGGLELALACDFIYASKPATFSQSEVKLGIMPGAMGTQNLPRACGIRRAKELSLTGQVFSSEQAYHWGIVNKICEPQDLMAEAINTARQISENAPCAIRQVKTAINASTHLDIFMGYALEVNAYRRLLLTKDREEGIAAFNEKRKPNFVGE